jgi:hypothetical protein
MTAGFAEERFLLCRVTFLVPGYEKAAYAWLKELSKSCRAASV